MAVLAPGAFQPLKNTFFSQPLEHDTLAPWAVSAMNSHVKTHFSCKILRNKGRQKVADCKQIRRMKLLLFGSRGVPPTSVDAVIAPPSIPDRLKARICKTGSAACREAPKQRGREAAELLKFRENGGKS